MHKQQRFDSPDPSSAICCDVLCAFVWNWPRCILFVSMITCDQWFLGYTSSVVDCTAFTVWSCGRPISARMLRPITAALQIHLEEALIYFLWIYSSTFSSVEWTLIFDIERIAELLLVVLSASCCWYYIRSHYSLRVISIHWELNRMSIDSIKDFFPLKILRISSQWKY